jgi:hypothetical protein
LTGANGGYATISEITKAERINLSFNLSYVSRVLRLTLFAPAGVAALLDGRSSAGLTLMEARAPFPVS